MVTQPIVDMRTYTIRPRGMAEYLRLFEELALPAALRFWGPPLGFYVTQIGPLNQVVHLWGFESLDAMQKGRAALAADPDFIKYLELTTGLVVAQEDRVVTPVSFKSLASGQT